MDDNSSNSIVTILKLVSCNYNELRDLIIQNIQSKLNEISQIPLLKVSLWILGEFSNNDLIEGSLLSIKKAIGSLPLEEEKVPIVNQTNEEEAKKSEANTKKIRVKTIILPDGTYGTEVINEADIKTSHFFFS